MDALSYIGMGSMMKRLEQWINGHSTPSHSDEILPVSDPASGRVYAVCPKGDARDLYDALNAANKAFTSWSMLKPSERAVWLNRLADGIEARFEAFVQCESRNTGKPLSLLRKIEIPRAIANFRFFAAQCQQSLDHAYHDEAGLNYTLHQPLGTVGVISPWNLPLYLLSWKLAPALAAGNCVIAKPSEVTPMSADLLASTASEIGFPAGVLNILQGAGDSVGAAMVAHPSIKAISFTGSTKVGSQIALACAGQFKKVTLEMGGKNPALVFADAPDHTIPDLVRASFQNSGQICLCVSRILIESSVYDKFKQEFINAVKSLRIGAPESESVEVGPVMSQIHFDKVMSYIESAKSEGANILCGGKALPLPGEHADGWFIAPTVIEGLPMDSRVCQEEIFGPVVSLHAFETEDEALELANDSDYGLAATVWTRDLSKAQRMANSLETGIVWVNTWMQRDLRTPFGGSKQSGYGREGGLDAIKFFTEPKTISIGSPYV
jgi:aminomuconate-semialdehyde/2-hydroxymuconate-6-semialdehyde dehydrogenase